MRPDAFGTTWSELVGLIAFLYCRWADGWTVVPVGFCKLCWEPYCVGYCDPRYDW